MTFEEFKKEPASGEFCKVGNIYATKGGLTRWEMFYKECIGTVYTRSSGSSTYADVAKDAAILANAMIEQAYIRFEEQS